MFSGNSGKDPRDEAAEWSWKLDSDELSEAEWLNFNDWVAKPDNGRELNAHHTVGNLAQDLPDDLKNDIIRDTFPERFKAGASRRAFVHPLWLSAVAAAVVLVAVVGGWPPFRPAVEYLSHSYSTEIGEIRNVTLPDGSYVDLNTQSQLRWIGSKGERRVVLLHGEALFEVVHDPAHPFEIVVDNSIIRVLGTRFDVYRKTSGNVVVTVLSGTVAVEGYGGGSGGEGVKPSWNVLLKANQQIEYSPTGLVADVHSTEAPRSVEWVQGILEARQDPLPNFVEELRRYSKKSIVIENDNGVRPDTCLVGGAFTILDVPAVLRKLNKSSGVAVTTTDNAYVLSCQKQPTRTQP